MATLRWIGAAGNRPQVTTITVANAWAAADTVTVTIGGQAIVLTLGTTSATSVTAVATAITAMINATSRTDDLESGDSRTAGGQQIPQWREVEASSAVGVVTIVTRENWTGWPVTITCTESTAGSGTATAATAQAATSRWHWNNTANWDTGAVPVNNDFVVFDFGLKGSGPRFGLPNNDLILNEVHVEMSFEGTIGLPEINRTDVHNPYTEYRQTHVYCADSGVVNNLWYIGRGTGAGSPMMNFRQANSVGAVYVSGTGRPDPTLSDYAFNLYTAVSTEAFTLDVFNGSCAIGRRDGQGAVVGSAKVGKEARLFLGPDVTFTTVTVDGGRTEIRGGTSLGTVHQTSGVVRLDPIAATTVTAFNVEAGTLEWIGGTITTLAVKDGGKVDCSGGTAVGMTNGNIYSGAEVYDPLGNITDTNGFDLIRCGLEDVKMNSGKHHTWTKSAV